MAQSSNPNSEQQSNNPSQSTAQQNTTEQQNSGAQQSGTQPNSTPSQSNAAEPNSNNNGAPQANTAQPNTPAPQANTAQPNGTASSQSSNNSISNKNYNEATQSNTGNNRELMESRLAVRVLKDTNQARDAISQGNDSKASQCVQDALNNIGRIDQMTASSQNGQQANIVPIYSEFGQLTVWGPIYNQQQRHSQTAFNRNNQINGQPQTTNTGEASREAQPPSADNGQQPQQPSAQNGQQGQPGQHPAIEDVTQNFTGVFLDVNMAQKHLQAANMALQDGNTVAANDALAAVQDGVTLVSVRADRPLVQARENLILARDMARDGRYADMRAPLRAAADALQSYQSEGTAHAADAGNMAQQIRSYAANLTSSAQNSSADMQQIDNWWQTTRSWSHSHSQQQQ